MPTKRPKNTPLHGLMFAAIGGFFFLVCFGMLYTGKAGRGGHFSTPQNDPLGYWCQVIGGVIGGIFATGYGVYLIVRGWDD
jgi:hypothetical protein